MNSPLKLASLVFLLGLTSSSQAQTYSLSTYQAEYNHVGVGFPLTEGVWDDPGYVVPIGFGFSFFDDVVSDLESLADFTVGGAMVAPLGDNLSTVLGVYSPDLIDRGFYTGQSASAIFFSYSGTPGQRVYIQEWLNVGFANGDTANGVFTDFVNFQLQLHEASGDIIYHFGSSSITNPLADYEGHSGPAVGLLKEMDISTGSTPEETMLLTGDPLHPTIVTDFMQVYLNGTIPENTVYRFAQPGTAVKEHPVQQPLSVFYPNPGHGEVYIRPGSEENISFPLHVLNAQGMIVKEIKGASELNLYDLPPGVYGIRYKSNERWTTERIMVIR